MTIFYQNQDEFPENILIRKFIGDVAVNDIIAS